MIGLERSGDYTELLFCRVAVFQLKIENWKLKVRASEQESSLLELLQWALPNFNEVKVEKRASEQESSLLELLQWAPPNFNEVKVEKIDEDQGRRTRKICGDSVFYSHKIKSLASRRSHESHKERIITLAFAIRLKTLGEADKLRALCDAASVRFVRSVWNQIFAREVPVVHRLLRHLLERFYNAFFPESIVISYLLSETICAYGRDQTRRWWRASA